MKYGQRRGVLKVTFFDKHIRDQDSFKSQEGFFLHLFYGSFSWRMRSVIQVAFFLDIGFGKILKEDIDIINMRDRQVYLSPKCLLIFHMEVKFVRNPKLEYNIGNISEFLMKIPPSLSYKIIKELRGWRGETCQD